MIAQVRTARPAIILNGKDYYSQLAPYLLNLSYTDNSDGKKADDLQFQLADRDKRFINDWMPDVGTFIDVSIIAERWYSPNAATLSLDCGRFWIDSVDFELPQHTVSVKASSIPTGVRLKAADETRGWENSTLRDIAQQIAGENKMTLDWQANVNPRFVRVEQTEESGLAFLKKRANDAKLSIKVHRNALVIFDEQTYEEKAAQFTLAYGNTAGTGGLALYRMASAKFHLKVNDTAKKAKVKHSRTETGETSSSEFQTDEENLPDVDTNVNEDPGTDPDSIEVEPGPLFREGEDELVGDWNAEADSAGSRKAKATLRDKNKDKFHAEIELALGCPLIASGQTLNLAGVGQFDGKWFLESAEHKIGPLYETNLKIRRCLKGY